jgi:hypothetical protein
MNAAVITKIEYKMTGEVDFTIIDFIPESAKFNQDSKRTGAGTLYTTTVDFNIAGLSVDADELTKKLNNRKCGFRITDSEDLVYLVGSDQYPARLNAKLAVDGSPGSFRGYRCNITQYSPTGYTLE